MANPALEVKGYKTLRKRINNLLGEVRGGELINDGLTEVAELGVEHITDKVDALKLVDTGAYKRGFQAVPAVGGEAFIITIVAYALLLEYGINGDVTIRSHTRKLKTGKSVTVKSHKRRMVRPAYFTVTSCLPDMRKDMSRVFRRRIVEALRE